ncbi:hypothetical protein [Modestobacter versicolor]|uniref:hypothetical protein n=1 Tax=Modestobacter versicolor TaxID=429133 RepID=UPI0034DE385A
MSTPRDRDGDGFDDGRADGPAGWQEPAHLGGSGDEGPAAVPPTGPRDPAGASTPGTWQPPGWDLPAVEPDRPGAPGATPAPGPAAAGPVPDPAGGQAPAPWQPPVTEQRQSDVPPVEQAPPRRGLGGLFGSRQPAAQPPARPAPPPSSVDWSGVRPHHESIAVPPADPFSTQAWATQLGWLLSDGTAPEDEALLPLLQSAPVRPGKDDRPSRVLRGRGNGLELVAFDVASPFGRGWLSTHAITAAPVLGDVPGFRLSPARMWRHGTSGLLQVPSPDPEFDRRWVLLAAEDGPQVRRLVEDPLVRQSLLGTDDGDELWSAAGFVAAIRPDGNRPQLIEHHARLLAGVVAALAAGR